MLLFVAATFAAELPLADETPPAPSIGYTGTLLLPDARHRAPGEAEVAAGAGGALIQITETCISSPRSPGRGCGGSSFEPMALPTLRAAWTPGADFRFESNVGVVVDGGFVGDLSLAWSAPVGEVVRLGAFAGVAGSIPMDLSGGDGVFGGGMMLSARWSRVGLDVSVPMFALNDPHEETPFYLPFALSEASVSLALGKGHALRLGMASLAPGAGWQYQGAHLLARADVHTLGLVSVGRVEVGARF